MNGDRRYPRVAASQEQHSWTTIPLAGLSRRDFLRATAGLGGAAMLNACGFGGNGSDPSGDEVAAVLDYWTLLDPEGDDPRGQAERQIFDILEAQTGIQVRERTTPWQEIDPNLLAAVQAGNPPEVSRVNYYNFRRHVEAGSLMPLDEMIARDLQQEDVDDFVVQLEGDSGIEAFLIENIGTALFLRRDWLDEADLEPPSTWEEFVAVGQELQSVQSGASGFLTFGSTAEAGHVAYIFQPMIMGRGGRILDDDGRAAFNGDAGVETFEFLRSLVYEHEIMPQDAATMAYAEQIDAFIAGRVGMIIEGSHRYARVREEIGDENLVVVRVPGPTAGEASPCSITGWALAIPQGSPDPENAWEMLKHRTDPEMQEIWAEVANGLPTRMSTLDRPFFESDAADIMHWWLDYMDDNGELTTAPVTDAELNETMAEAMQEVLLDESANVAEVLDRAAERYNSIVA